MTGRKPRYAPITLEYFRERSTIDLVTGCWLWTKAINRRHGYGAVMTPLGTRRAHRVAFETANGISVPRELDVCHRCDVRHCVNPGHLFVGTRADNMQDCVQKGRHFTPSLKGEDCPAAKLSADQVRAIRADTRSHRALGRVYGVNKGTIGYIRRGLTWRSI